jgi:hypothetical protein
MLIPARITEGHGILARMTIATWILAIATAALAIEGGTALQQWITRLRPGKAQRELGALQDQITLLRHAVWMDVTRADQGDVPSKLDDRVRDLLMSDGWRPDRDYVRRFGYFDLHRIMTDDPATDPATDL